MRFLTVVIAGFSAAGLAFAFYRLFTQPGMQGDFVVNAGAITLFTVILITAGSQLPSLLPARRHARPEHDAVASGPLPPGHSHLYYQLAACCWLAFWCVLLAPVAVAAYHLWREFHWLAWDGLAMGLDQWVARSEVFVAVWGIYWLAAIAGSFLGFILFKLIGRYSLPKPHRPRIRVLYGTARLVFFFVSLTGMALSLAKLSAVADHIVDKGVLHYPEATAEGQKDIEDTLLFAAAKAAATEDFDAIILQALREENLVRAGIYVDLAELVQAPISPDTRAAYQYQSGPGPSAWRAGKDCFRGGASREAETITQIVCMITVDLTAPAYADWADMVRQLVVNPFITNQDTEPLIVAAAALGIVLRGMSQGEEITTIRAGTSMLKATASATRAFRVSSRLSRQYRHILAEAYDMPKAVQAYTEQGGLSMIGLGALARVNPQSFIRPAGWRRLQRESGHLLHLARAGRGPSTAVTALRYSDNLDELHFLGRVTQRFGRHTDGVLDLLKSRWRILFKHYEIPRMLTLALGGWSALFAACWGVLLASLSSFLRGRLFRFITLRLLKRADRRLAKARP